MISIVHGEDKPYALVLSFAATNWDASGLLELVGRMEPLFVLSLSDFGILRGIDAATILILSPLVEPFLMVPQETFSAQRDNATHTDTSLRTGKASVRIIVM